MTTCCIYLSVKEFIQGPPTSSSGSWQLWKFPLSMTVISTMFPKISTNSRLLRRCQVYQLKLVATRVYGSKFSARGSLLESHFHSKRKIYIISKKRKYIDQKSKREMRWRRAVPTCPQRGDTVAASLGEKSKRFTCRFYLYDARHTTNNRCHGEFFYFIFC